MKTNIQVDEERETDWFAPPFVVPGLAVDGDTTLDEVSTFAQDGVGLHKLHPCVNAGKVCEIGPIKDILVNGERIEVFEFDPF